jgi:hypothetical protein
MNTEMACKIMPVYLSAYLAGAEGFLRLLSDSPKTHGSKVG